MCCKVPHLFIHCSLPRICRGVLGTCRLQICDLAINEVPAQSERKNREEAVTAGRQEDSQACLMESGKQGLGLDVSEDRKKLSKRKRKRRAFRAESSMCKGARAWKKAVSLGNYK